MKKLLKIAKILLAENENASLTGTLMLHLRGIDLGREPKDIDILISDYAPTIKFPKGFNVEQTGQSSDGSGAKYLHDNIIIDVLSDGEKPDIINGWRLGTLEKLMEQKYIYSKQDNDDAKKHHDDLIKLGFVFPVEEESNTIDDLPF